jgi:membrane fusion protein (multidrug efflux system)
MRVGKSDKLSFITANNLLMKKVMLFGSVFTLLLTTSCGNNTEEHESNQTFEVTSPLQMDTTTTLEYVCQIRAISHIEVRALEKGYLDKIYVDEGQMVKKGQLMFQIMPLMYQAELQKAEAEANVAKTELDNSIMLAENNVISKRQLAVVQAKYNKAKAELKIAQVHLGFTEIRAPFDGLMDRFQVRLGSLVDEGDLLTTLSDNSKLWVYFNVPESEYLNFRMSNLGKKSMGNVKLMMANNQLFPEEGVVETIEADFNNETGNIAFRATFPNPDRLLRHGETGNILMDSKIKNAIIIPQKATFEILEKKYAFVVDQDNHVHQVELEIAGELPDIYIIRKGIKASDRILLEGIRKVTNGQKIKYRYKDPKKVINGLKVFVE